MTDGRNPFPLPSSLEQSMSGTSIELRVVCVRCGFTFATLVCPPMCAVCWKATEE